jgi:hypothetical protein
MWGSEAFAQGQSRRIALLWALRLTVSSSCFAVWRRFAKGPLVVQARHNFVDEALRFCEIAHRLIDGTEYFGQYRPLRWTKLH